MAPGRAPQIGFESRAAYIPNNVVVLTFDDVPDRPYTPSDMVPYRNFGAGDRTRELLDWLDANQLHFDFFFNTQNFCDVDKYPDCLTQAVRILKTQNPGNHTVHHVHMGSDATYDAQNVFNSGCRAIGMQSMLTCEDEITGVESFAQIVTDGAIHHLTRLRAPYGEPFMKGGTALDEIAGVVARFAIHVGWAIDAADSDQDSNGKGLAKPTFAEDVIRALGTGPGKGNWGIVRMRWAYPWSLDALKTLVDPKTGYLPTHGFKLGSVEDVICWKYGAHSWELISQITGHSLLPN